MGDLVAMLVLVDVVPAALLREMAIVMMPTIIAPANTMEETAVEKRISNNINTAKRALAKILALLETTAKEHVPLAVHLRVMEYAMTPTITVDVSMTVATAVAKMEMLIRGCIVLHANASTQISKGKYVCVVTGPNRGSEIKF